MSGDGRLIYWSRNISRSSSHPHNDNDGTSKEGGLEVSLGEKNCGHRSLDTIHSYSSNHVGCGCRSFDNSHAYYRNNGRYVVIG